MYNKNYEKRPVTGLFLVLNIDELHQNNQAD